MPNLFQFDHKNTKYIKERENLLERLLYFWLKIEVCKHEKIYLLAISMCITSGLQAQNTTSTP